MFKKTASVLVSASVLAGMIGVLPITAGAAGAPVTYVYDDFSAEVPEIGNVYFTTSTQTSRPKTDSAVTADEKGVLFVGSTGGRFDGPFFDGKANPETMILDFSQKGAAAVFEMKFKIGNAANPELKFFELQDADSKTVAPLVTVDNKGAAWAADLILNGRDEQIHLKECSQRDKWTHMMLVLSVADNMEVMADLYATVGEGQETVHAGPVAINKGDCKGVQRCIRMTGMMWGQTLTVDDFIVRSLGDLTFDGDHSTVYNGEMDVPVTTKEIYLNFNTVLDKTSLSNIKVYEDYTGEMIPVEVEAVERVLTDPTRALVKLKDNMKSGVVYGIDCTGLTDMLGSVSNEQVLFMTDSSAVPAISQTTPVRGAQNVSITQDGASITYTQDLMPERVTRENITIEPAVDTYDVRLVNGNTIRVDFGSNLQVGKEYTISVNNNPETGVVSATGEAIGDADTTLAFSTVTAVGYVYYPTIDVGSLKIGENGLVSSTNHHTPFVEPGQTPQGWQMFPDRAQDGGVKELYNAGLISHERGWRLANRSPVEMVYVTNNANPGEIFNAQYDFVCKYDPTEPSIVMSFEASADNVNFTSEGVVAECIKVSNDKYGNDSWARWAYKVTALPQGTKYLKVRMMARNYDPETMDQLPDGDSGLVADWNSEVYAITLNPTPSTIPAALTGEVSAAGDEIVLNFDQMLFGASVNAQDFTITSASAPQVTAATVDETYQTVTLKLDASLAANAAYTLGYEGIEDVNGNAVIGSVDFTAGAAASGITVEGYLTANGEQVDFAAGTFVPKFAVNNADDAATGTFIFAVYNNGTLENIVAADAQAIATGESTIDLPEITIENAEGRTYKFFAWDGFDSMKPIQ